MTPDEAMFAGFLEGVNLAQKILAQELARARHGEFRSTILKRVEDELAGRVAERMEDAGMEPEGL